jgi:hypothetical protein
MVGARSILALYIFNNSVGLSAKIQDMTQTIPLMSIPNYRHDLSLTNLLLLTPKNLNK